MARQLDLVESLRRGGHDHAKAERLLHTLRQTLGLWKDHQEAILGGIAYLEGAGGYPTAGTTPPPPP